MKHSEFPRTWTIGVDAALQIVLDDPGSPPLLARALSRVLAWQTRNETTVRAALIATRIAPQFVAALLALGATATVEGEGAKEVPVQALVEQRSARDAAALHVTVTGGTRWGEALVARTSADEPIVAAYACIEMKGDKVGAARVALTGAWREPARLTDAPARLVDGPLDEASIEAVAEAVRGEVAPVGDFRGSEEYRRAMAGVCTRRALAACLRWDGETHG